MIPVLYAADETAFTSNGLGLLYDCINAVCTEERNGQYEVSFTYPVNGLHFSEIEHSCIIKAVPSDGANPQLFRIYYSSKPINGKVNFKAEHISYQQKHIPVEPYKATNASEALTGIKEHALEDCPFDFWTDNTNMGSFSLEQPASARSIIGGMRGSILDVFGGEYMFDNYLVRLYKQRGQDNGVTLRYGKNITDIKQEKNIADTITGVMPYWFGQNDDQEDVYVSLPEKVIRSETADNYPYQRTIVLDCSGEWQNQPTEEQLRGYAQSYINQTGVGIPHVSIDVSFVALWQTDEYKEIANLERVRLCDTVTVEFEPLGISAKAKVVKTEYDILKDRYKSIELGDARTNFAGQVKADIDASSAEIVKKTVTPSFLQREINRATELIKGGLGGYVVFTSNADGQPQEITIMDADNIVDAVQCIRINKNGIGFSSTGYDGTYTSAWTIDGRFNADFIATGTLSANLIKGGILKLGGEDNGNGVIQVFDGNKNLIGEWDKDGLTASGDLRLTDGIIEGFIGECHYPTYNQVSGETGWSRANGFLIRRYNSNKSAVISSHSNILNEDKEINTDYAPVEIVDKKTIALNGETSGLVYQTTYAEKHFRLESFRYGSAKDPKIKVIVGTYSGDNQIRLESDDAKIEVERTTFSTSYEDSVTLRKGAAILKVISAGGNEPTGKIGDKTIQTASSSSRRYKHDIGYGLTKDRASENLLNLPVAEFVFNDGHPLQYADMKGKKIPGIIAEDVAEIYPSAAILNENGQVESWDERRLIPAMLDLIQKQDGKIKELEARLTKLEELPT